MPSGNGFYRTPPTPKSKVCLASIWVPSPSRCSLPTSQETPPQGSKRYVGGGRVIEDNPGTRVWRQSAQLQLATYRSRQLKEPIDEAVLVQAVFCLPRPKSVRSALPTSKSSYDLDKLCRALGDALEGAGVLKNDSRITTWHARKRYAEADSNGPAITGVFLRIYKEKQ